MNPETKERTLEAWIRSWPQHQQQETVFAVISVCVPFAGLILAFGVLFLSPPDPDSGHMGLRDVYNAIGVMFFSFIIGTVLGLIALARRERSKILVAVGLLLNGCPLLWMLLKIVFHD